MQDYRPQLHDWAREAWQWLLDNVYTEYNTNLLYKNNVSFNYFSKFDKSTAECTVHWIEYRESISKVTINLIKEEIWSTYRRKSVGMYAPVMPVSLEFAIKVQAVHELTHFIQAVEGRDFKETETTFNEIKFAFDHNFSYFEKCKVIMDMRYSRNENIKCVI